MSAEQTLKSSVVLCVCALQLGRIIFGFGGESLGVARTTFIATWFKKRELGTTACRGRNVRLACERKRLDGHVLRY